MTSSRQIAVVMLALLGLIVAGQAFLSLLPAALR
jgi:hypothetical protein